MFEMSLQRAWLESQFKDVKTKLQLIMSSGIAKSLAPLITAVPTTTSTTGAEVTTTTSSTISNVVTTGTTIPRATMAANITTPGTCL